MNATKEMIAVVKSLPKTHRRMGMLVAENMFIAFYNSFKNDAEFTEEQLIDMSSDAAVAELEYKFNLNSVVRTKTWK